MTEPDFDLQDRNSLRRVAGLSTELEDISEVEYRQLRLERVVLVGVWTEGTAEDAENSLTELKLLAETAGSEVLDALIQRRPKPTRPPTSDAARSTSCATPPKPPAPTPSSATASSRRASCATWRTARRSRSSTALR